MATKREFGNMLNQKAVKTENPPKKEKGSPWIGVKECTCEPEQKPMPMPAPRKQKTRGEALRRRMGIRNSRG